MVSRGNRAFENYFVNGRYVKSNIISRAIEEGYKGFVMQHKYPFTVLHLTIDGKMLDVNVHPTKMELRISNQQDVYRFIYMAINDALNGRELIPIVSFGKEEKKEDKRVVETKAPEPFEKKRLQEMQAQKAPQQKTPESQPVARTATPTFASGSMPTLTNTPAQTTKTEDIKPEKPATKEPLSEQPIAKPAPPQNSMVKESPVYQVTKAEEPVINSEQLELFETNLLAEESRSKHKLIGQLFKTYWLVEFEDKLFIIDQHAAHEKVLYERNVKLWKSKEHSSQLISPPLILTLSNKEEEILHTYQSYFEELGFEISSFGGKEYSITAVPMNLYGLAQKELFIELIDSLDTMTGKLAPDMISDKLASMSYKAAVKRKPESVLSGDG